MRQALEGIARSIRKTLLPEQTREHLEALRLRELEIVGTVLPPRGRLLEIGAGSGWQSRELARRGYSVSAIDIPQSNFAGERIWSVADYDGERIPFEDASFDIIFSSNVLEHVPHVRALQREIRRVLHDDGVVVHVVPSASWRVWTNVTHPVRYGALPLRHGEHAANAWSEVLTFRKSAWRSLFQETGWQVEVSRPVGLFYTGCSVADHYLPIRGRELLAKIAGSACHLFVLRKIL